VSKLIPIAKKKKRMKDKEAYLQIFVESRILLGQAQLGGIPCVDSALSESEELQTTLKQNKTKSKQKHKKQKQKQIHAENGTNPCRE
jgi:hypothetical protein